MYSFHQQLGEENVELLKQACRHPFILQIADGSITEERFLRWLTQDYLWVREFEQFLAILSSKAPREARRIFFEALLNLHGEIEIFEENAAKTRAVLSGRAMSLTCRAHASFLLATAYGKTYEEALVACYAGELAYLEAWSFVKRTQTQPGPWQDFVELWTAEGFGQWVGTLAKLIDEAAETASPSVRAQMKETFRITLAYELRFWNIAFEGGDC